MNTISLISICLILASGLTSAKEKADKARLEALEADEEPLSRTVPSRSPVFTVDSSKDYHFELGRGSGLDGLETISFGRNGVVKMFRLHMYKKVGVWHTRTQTASILLPADATVRIFKEVENQGVMKMAAEYHADVDDGTQWVLLIKQDSKAKAVYFNNYFPKGIKKLAERLDKELAAAGLGNATWKDIPDEQSRDHEKLLWKSIHPPDKPKSEQVMPPNGP